MKLLSLDIRNFKGVKNLTVNTGGANVSIYGDNGTGKTTIADAYTWLLTGKDSKGSTKFDIYPVGADDGISVSVTARFCDNGGADFTLQRIHKKVFECKNGQAEQLLSGNTTDYYISGVPKLLKDYSKFVAETFGDENKLMILTDPDYFAGKMDYKARRDILIKTFAPHYGDQDVIANHEELSPLAEYIGAMTTVAELSAQKKAQRKAINAELSAIPARIDELDRSRPEIPGESEAGKLSALAVEKQKLNNELITLKSGEKISALNARINDTLSEQTKAEAEYIKGNFGKNRDVETRLRNLRADLISAENNIGVLKSELSGNKLFVDGLKKEISELRERWGHEDQRFFDTSGGVCQYCGQALPEEQVNKAKADFNQRKVEAKEAITAEGKEKSILLASMEGKTETLERDLQTETANCQQIQSIINELSQTVIEPPAFNTTPEYAGYQDRIKTLKDNLVSLQSEQSAAVESLEQKINAVNLQLSGSNDREAALQQVKRINTRMKELKAEEKRLGIELAAADNLIKLTEDFTRYQADDITQKINGAFQCVSWKLFEPQVNGGTKAICEPTVGDVKYGSNLNTAAKLNAGLDIIRTLAQASGYDPLPIFIDNAESVTGYIPMDAQVIKLYVSEFDSDLRIEVQGSKC